MPPRKRLPWNAGKQLFPELQGGPAKPPPAPMPMTPGTLGHSTPGAPAEQWECLRCEQLRDGLDPLPPDHAPRCPYRGTGRDPERDG